jgi:hypothetical protein
MSTEPTGTVAAAIARPQAPALPATEDPPYVADSGRYRVLGYRHTGRSGLQLPPEPYGRQRALAETWPAIANAVRALAASDGRARTGDPAIRALTAAAGNGSGSSSAVCGASTTTPNLAADEIHVLPNMEACGASAGISSASSLAPEDEADDSEVRLEKL